VTVRGPCTAPAAVGLHQADTVEGSCPCMRGRLFGSRVLSCRRTAGERHRHEDSTPTRRALNYMAEGTGAGRRRPRGTGRKTGRLTGETRGGGRVLRPWSERRAVGFADLLIELRLGRGLSQEALAARAAVSVRAISDLERGITRRRRSARSSAGTATLRPLPAALRAVLAGAGIEADGLGASVSLLAANSLVIVAGQAGTGTGTGAARRAPGAHSRCTSPPAAGSPRAPAS
jgi:transcriptional regulator with XRE-family HTH domain